MLSLQNVDGSAVSAGAPVYIFTSANTFKRGNASATSAKHVVGLVIDGSVAVSAIGRVQTQGQVTLTTAQWDSITGGTGGLTPARRTTSTPRMGLLTTTAPSVTIRRPVGIALSTTVMFLHGDAGGWDALSDAVSVGTATANALSNAISVVSTQLTNVSASLTSWPRSPRRRGAAAATVSAPRALQPRAAAVSAAQRSRKRLASDVGRISQIVSALGNTGQMQVVAATRRRSRRRRRSAA
jgi:hypothetical protein